MTMRHYRRHFQSPPSTEGHVLGVLLAYNNVSYNSLIFSPMYLPFKKPLCSPLINFAKTIFNLAAIHEDALLYIVLSKVIGL